MPSNTVLPHISTFLQTYGGLLPQESLPSITRRRTSRPQRYPILCPPGVDSSSLTPRLRRILRYTPPTPLRTPPCRGCSYLTGDVWEYYVTQDGYTRHLHVNSPLWRRILLERPPLASNERISGTSLLTPSSSLTPTILEYLGLAVTIQEKAQIILIRLIPPENSQIEDPFPEVRILFHYPVSQWNDEQNKYTPQPFMQVRGTTVSEYCQSTGQIAPSLSALLSDMNSAGLYAGFP